MASRLYVRDPQRAIDQNQRRGRDNDRKRLHTQAAGHADAHDHQQAVEPQTLEPEYPGVRRPNATREPQHDRREAVVHEHHDGRGDQRHDDRAGIRVAEVANAKRRQQRVGGARREHVRGDVVELDVERPRSAHPFGNVRDDDDDHNAGPGQHEHARHQERLRRVIRLVPRRNDGERVGDGRARQ